MRHIPFLLLLFAGCGPSASAPVANPKADAARTLIQYEELKDERTRLEAKAEIALNDVLAADKEIRDSEASIGGHEVFMRILDAKQKEQEATLKEYIKRLSTADPPPEAYRPFIEADQKKLDALPVETQRKKDEHLRAIDKIKERIGRQRGTKDDCVRRRDGLLAEIADINSRIKKMSE